MAISILDLRIAWLRYPSGAVFATRKAGQRTGFLSHSHLDRRLAQGLQLLLREQGLDLYIDWQDESMPSTPDRRTAERIQSMIRRSDVFLFLATANSMASRWCSWELGFADGVLKFDQMAIVPTKESDGTYHGNEYLLLYRHIDQPGSSASMYLYDIGSYVGKNLSVL